MKLSVKIPIVAVITLLFIALLLYSVVGIVLLGPSKDAGRMLLAALNDSPYTSFIPSLYMNEETENEILNSYKEGEHIEATAVIIEKNK